MKWSFLGGRRVISTMVPLAIYHDIFLRDGQIVHDFMTQLRGASTLLWRYSSDLRSAPSSVPDLLPITLAVTESCTLWQKYLICSASQTLSEGWGDLVYSSMEILIGSQICPFYTSWSFAHHTCGHRATQWFVHNGEKIQVWLAKDQELKKR